MSEQKVETIWVKTAPEEGERVGLSEKHPDHPKTAQFPQGGECYVAGQRQEPQQVARTPGVMEALQKKRLVEVSAPAKPSPAPAADADAPAPSTTTTTTTRRTSG